jgi:sodium/potassium/calcium exchanger 1
LALATLHTWTFPNSAFSPAPHHSGRRLLVADDPSCHENVTQRSLLCDLIETYPKRDRLTVEQIKNGGVILYILGSLYMFFAIAIVCDEFFVPSLEIIAERLNLSNDVAGATLMAAGGSAPELFTSFIGTFGNSAVGFGTIVGSAVFNVLFVIAMCTIYSKDTLQLTWWPLFRDSTYYTVTLLLLALFFMNPKSEKYECTNGKDDCSQIELWEAAILLVLYLGYVSFMSIHHKVLDRIQRCRGKTEVKVVPMEAQPKIVETPLESESSEGPPPKPMNSENVIASTPATLNRVDIYVPPAANFRLPGTFRAGLLQLIMKNKSLLDTAGVHVVHRIQGDALATFEKLDIDKNGVIDQNEINQLLVMLEAPVNETALNDVMKDLDTDGDGKVTFDDFQAWYVRSEKRIMAELEATFNQIDVDGSGDLDKSEVLLMIREMNKTLNKDELLEIVESIFGAMKEGRGGQKERNITKAEFIEWYRKSSLWEEKKKAVANEAEEAEGYELEWPDGWKARVFFMFMLPITSTLYYSMYFLRPSLGAARRKLRWGALGFMISIGWIGSYAYLMVWWVEVAGACFEIPSQIMGLTFLAAGTSVPDLLSSVIVAKMGEGDMAVSSSLGSNIFDVTIGLPLPWLTYILYFGHPVTVDAENTGLSILILVGMLSMVIVIVASSGWRMTKRLGMAMLCLYLLFVAQDLIRWQMTKKN